MTRDQATVDDFGHEWARFDQSAVSAAELHRIFDTYFAIFPWERLPEDAVGVDVGCGSGRWAEITAARVGSLVAVDPSGEALAVAERRLGGRTNCTVIKGAAGDLPIRNASLDFGYSLGVLHHTPDTQAALYDCVAKLKPGAPFLIYLYYAFDNRPAWFRRLWKVSDSMRRLISTMPFRLKLATTTAIAATVYWPLARSASVAERRGRSVARWPLSLYRDKSFYVMRNDSLDRFGTRLEQRFSAAEITAMMERAGLSEVRLSQTEPFWCAVGLKQ